jgi:hypothetical protein
MNRSYSKIRHIQETNQLLEKRVLTEDDYTEKLKLLNTSPDLEFETDIDGYTDKYEDLMGDVRNLLYDLKNVKGELGNLYDEVVNNVDDNELASEIDDLINRIENTLDIF